MPKKRWGDLTEEEVDHIRQKKCKRCTYAGQGSTGRQTCCNYMFITGKSRGCRPDECDKYTPGNRMGKEQNFQIRAGRKPMSPSRTHLGVLIEQGMRTMGITQRQLSKASGVTSSAIGNWRFGKAKPGARQLKKVCAILGIPMEQAAAAVEKGELEGMG